MLYDQTYNNSFHEKLELIQHSGALTTTSTKRGSSREKLYEELGFESPSKGGTGNFAFFQNNNKPIISITSE